MKKVLALVFALFATCAEAQWQVPVNRIPLGRGPGVIGFNSLVLGSTGTCLISNGTSSAPSFQACPGTSGTLAGTANQITLTTVGSTTTFSIPSPVTLGVVNGSTFTTSGANGAYSAIGTLNGFSAFDRSGGPTSTSFYRDGSTGHIYDSDNGDLITFTNGATGITFPKYGAGVISSSAGGVLSSGTIAVTSITASTANRLAGTNGSGVFGVVSVPTGLSVAASALTFDIPSLTTEGSVDANNTYVLCETASTTKKCTAGSIAAASTAGVASLGGATGAVSLSSGLSIVGTTLTNVWDKASNNISNNNTGNVGINTTTPNPTATSVYNKVLTIAQTSTTVQNRAVLELWTNATPPNSSNFGQLNFLSGTAPTTPAAAISSQSPTTGSTPGIGNLTFFTASAAGSISERMRITQSGNVGIGTITPSVMLQVQGNVAISGGKPWCDVTAQGAVGDSVTDDTNAFVACIAAVVNGGMVFVPPAQPGKAYCVNSGLTITSYVSLVGPPGMGAALDACGSDVNVVTMTGSLVVMKDLSILGKGGHAVGTVFAAATETFGASKRAVLMTSCVDCLLTHVDIQAGTGLHTVSGENNIDWVRVNTSYADSLLQAQGGGWYRRMKLDHSVGGFPIPADASTINPWAPSTVYGANTIVTFGGYYWGATVGGTSGGAGTFTPNNYGQTVTDNTVTWVLLRPFTYYGLQVNSNETEFYGFQLDMSGVYTAGMAMTNTAVGGAVPSSVKCTQCIIGNQWPGYGVDLQYGGDVHFTDTSIGGFYGIWARSTFGTGLNANFNLTVKGGNIFAVDFGIRNEGTAGIIVDGITAAANPTSSSGIALYSASSRTIFSNNIIAGGKVGIKMDGAADYFNVVNNICAGSATTCVTIAATGANNTVSGNH